MAFPQTPLRITSEAALGADLTASPWTWSWTDVSALVRSPSLSITRGRASEFTTAPPSRCPTNMANDDGRWVEHNPTGIWYGLIGLNTPLRHMVNPDINTASDTFTRTVSNGWGTATSGGTWTVVGTASDYSTTGTTARATHTAAATRHYATLPTSLTNFDITVRVKTGALATGAAISAGVLFRYVDANNSLRYELLFNTDQTIAVRAVLRGGGSDAFGASHTVGGLTHVAGAFYRVRAQSTSPTGQVFRIKVWADNASEPSTWTASSFTNAAVTAGLMGLTSSRETGNTNTNATVDFDDYSFVDGPVPRQAGYIDSLPRRWGDSSATILNAPLNALGLSGRLQQGGVLQSAIRRAVVGAGIPAKGYWPCEDKSNATQLASGIPGGLPAQVTAPMSLGQGIAFGSDPVIVAGTGQIVGQVKPYTGTDWSCMVLINMPTAPSASQDLLIWTTSGSYFQWQLVLTPQAGPNDLLSMQAYDAFGGEHLADPGVSVGKPYGRQLWIEITAQQVGGSINWAATMWSGNSGIGTAGTVTATAGTVTSVRYAAPLLTNAIVGHISVWGTVLVSFASLGSLGYAGELATDRFTRLGGQENVPTTLVATPTYDVAAMGPPTSSTLLAQFREIEASDQGILFDGLDGSMTYLPREFRFNQPVALTLDVAQHQVSWPAEVDNDQQVFVNDATSTQPNGTSYRYMDTTSSRSVTKVGYYSKPFPTNLYVPQDLRQDAEFRVALGTVPEDRWTTLTISLTGNPSLIAAWLQCDVGSRIQIVNTASLYTPDVVDLILEGYQEDISSTDWRVTLYTSSAKPWNAWIAETGPGNSSLPDSGSSTLAAGVNSSATSLSVATSDPLDLWTTGVVNFDIGIAGERMTVTNISGGSSPQTFTVVRHVNGVVKAQSTTDALGNPTQVHLWNPSVLAL